MTLRNINQNQKTFDKESRKIVGTFLFLVTITAGDRNGCIAKHQ